MEIISELNDSNQFFPSDKFVVYSLWIYFDLQPPYYNSTITTNKKQSGCIVQNKTSHLNLYDPDRERGKVTHVVWVVLLVSFWLWGAWVTVMGPCLDWRLGSCPSWHTSSKWSGPLWTSKWHSNSCAHNPGGGMHQWTCIWRSGVLECFWRRCK